MTDPLDRLLRDTVHDLAGDADVISDRDRHRLAVHAVDQAHTLRIRRRGAVAALVALVTAFAVGLPYGLRHIGPRPGPPTVLPAGVPDVPGVPTHVIDDTSNPIELADGWYVLGNNLVLDRTTNTYVDFGRVQETLPSPDGRWVATMGSTGAYRVYDLQNGGNRRYESDWFQTSLSRFTVGWSPRSDMLLVSSLPFDDDDSGAEGPERRLILTFIDVVHGEVKDVNVDLTGLACHYCPVTWLPSGGELALVLDDPDLTTTGIQVLSLDGERLRTLPVRGYPLGTGAWSPDGRYVFVGGTTETGDRRSRLVEIETGKVVAGWEGLTDALRVQWIDNERLLTFDVIGDYAGTAQRCLISLWSLDGRLLERWIPPVDVLGFPPMPEVLGIHLG